MNKFWKEKNGRIRALTWLVLLLGVGLRLNHYLECRSFWLDEAILVLWTTALTLPQIAFNTIFDANAPFYPTGFMLVQKSASLVLGNNEYAFRLFPLLAGTCSLFLFRALAEQILSRRAALLALAIFALADPLIYFSAEAKPYSVDLLVTMILYLTALRLMNRPLGMNDRLGLTAVGFLAMGFSNPSSFVLAGVGSALFYTALKRRDKDQWRGLFYIFMSWLAAFVFWYLAAYQFLHHNSVIQAGSQSYYPPTGVGPFVEWVWRSLGTLMVLNTGIVPGFLALGVAGAGLYSLTRKDLRWLLLFLLPLALALAAATMHKFPFYGRFILFSSVGVVICLAEGACFLGQVFWRWKLGRSVWWGIVLWFLFVSLQTSGVKFFSGREFEESRPLVQTLSRQWMAGDALFVNDMGNDVFLHYWRSFHGPRLSTATGCFADRLIKVNGKDCLLRGFQSFQFNDAGYYIGTLGYTDVLCGSAGDAGLFGRNPRTWVLLSHFKEDSRAFVLSYLDTHGKKLFESQSRGSELYLYDLSGSK